MINCKDHRDFPWDLGMCFPAVQTTVPITTTDFGGVAGEQMEEFSSFVSDPPLFYLTAEIAELEYFKIFAQLATKREGFFGGNGSFILQPDQAPPANDEASRHIEALLMAAS